MKSLPGLITGVVTGLFVAAVLMWTFAPDLMLREQASPYTVDKTVEIIKRNALAKGWVVPDIKPLHRSINKHTGRTIAPVYLINICHPDYAYDILNVDRSKIVSVFMPCTISVYEKSDGKTYVGSMNAGLLGKMFGGNVAEIMGEKVARDQASFIAMQCNDGTLC